MGHWTMVSFNIYEHASLGKWSGSLFLCNIFLLQALMKHGKMQDYLLTIFISQMSISLLLITIIESMVFFYELRI